MPKNEQDRSKLRERDFKCRSCLAEFSSRTTNSETECRFCGGQAILSEQARSEGMSVHGRGFIVE